MNKLIICGIGETADLAFQYFTFDSDYEIIGFAANEEFCTKETHLDLPVFAIEELTKKFEKDAIEVFVAVSYTKLNRVRKNVYNEVKKLGFKFASYISSKAFVWPTAKIGENAFIFENNVIQHGVTIGNNVILWSGNHIGHQTKIEDHVYISSHCVISGFCKIGEYSFLGVNCTVNDFKEIAQDTIIGSGAVITKNTKKGTVMVSKPATVFPKSSYATFKVEEHEI